MACMTVKQILIKFDFFKTLMSVIGSSENFTKAIDKIRP